MKIKSDLVWAIILLALAAISFFLGMKKGSMGAEDQLEDKLEEIKILESQNQQLSDELSSRGVYSYPQANIMSKPLDSFAMALITLNGKDPIEDLKLRRNMVYNYSAVDASEAQPKGKLSDLGTLKSHNPSAFEIPLTENEVGIHFEYESNRKKWHQYIRIKRSDDGKIRSFWVLTNDNSVIIDKHIDPGFPTDEAGQVTIWKDQKVDYSDLEMNSIFRPGN